MIIMSIDLGKVRTGIAVCDKNETLASPCCVIKEKNENMLLEKIIQKALEIKAEKIVVGLPKNMDGTLGESAKRVLKFGEVLKSKINIPIVAIYKLLGINKKWHNDYNSRKVSYIEKPLLINEKEQKDDKK